jgi:hypothetical protein
MPNVVVPPVDPIMINTGLEIDGWAVQNIGPSCLRDMVFDKTHRSQRPKSIIQHDDNLHGPRTPQVNRYHCDD